MKPKFLKKLLFFAVVLFGAYAFCHMPAAAAADATVDNMNFNLNRKSNTMSFTGLSDGFVSGSDVNLPAAIYENYTYVYTYTYMRYSGQDTDFKDTPENSAPTPNRTITFTDEYLYPVGEDEASVSVQYQIASCFSGSPPETLFKSLDDIKNNSNVESYYTIETRCYSDCFPVTNVLLSSSEQPVCVGNFYVPDSVSYIDVPNGVRAAASYSVSSDNPTFSANSDGLLLSKDGSKLVLFPTLHSWSGTVTLQPTVTAIDDYAFSCDADIVPLLDFEFLFPSTVDSVSHHAFDGCCFQVLNLSLLDNESLECLSLGLKAFDANECILPTADGSGALYFPSFVRQTKVLRLPDNLRFVVGSYRGYPALEFASFGSSLDAILNYAGETFSNDVFDLVDGLLIRRSSSSVVYALPDPGCQVLHLPHYVRAIEAYAFTRMPSLTNVFLNEGLLFVDGLAFHDSPCLSSVVFPSSLLVVNSAAFDSCPSLSTLTFKTSPLVLGSYCFAGSRVNTITVPCGFDFSLFDSTGVTVDYTSDPPAGFFVNNPENPAQQLTGVFVYQHVSVYDDQRKETVCSVCGEVCEIPRHYCSYNPATCSSPERCSICGRVKNDSVVNPHAHEWSIDLTKGNPVCSLCGYELTGTSSDLTKKVILTRSTSELVYNDDAELVNFEGEKKDKPKQSDLEILTCDDYSGDKFSFTLKLSDPDFTDIQDYRVTANNSILTATHNQDNTYTYEVELNEALTLINIECPYNASGSGVFINSDDALYVFNTEWRTAQN